MAGSETRQRNKGVTIRVTDREMEALRLRADKAALSIAGYTRARALDEPPPRQSRRACVDHQLIAQVLAQLGKSRLAANANQIAHKANMLNWAGKEEAAQLASDVRDMRDLLMQALNKN